MKGDGFRSPFAKTEHPIPYWLVAELTYRCPLNCFYCSNPVNHGSTFAHELSTADWLRTLTQARALGAVQLGLTGGEPLLRRDLEILVAEARNLGFYTNLITSGVGLSEMRLEKLKVAGLEHIQLSLQASTKELNDHIGGAQTFDLKIKAAHQIKKFEYPMVLNVVVSRLNIDSVSEILDLAEELGADYVELANVQYEGWATLKRAHLLPTREQIERAQATVEKYQQRPHSKMKIFYVLPDYYQDRPKACSAGWGNLLMVVAPDGLVLPCHGARKLPGIEFPKVQDADLAWIWKDSPAFNTYRGDSWMKDPCRACPEKKSDFGGCRCQAFALTGDAKNADPVCAKSPHRNIVDAALNQTGQSPSTQPRHRTHSPL